MDKLIDVKYMLDELGFVEMKYYVLFSSEKKIILEFVIILFLLKNNKKIEVMKYDYSQKEKLHVHKNYLKKPRKEYIVSEVTIDFVKSLKRDIELNWEKYVHLFNQKEYI